MNNCPAEIGAIQGLLADLPLLLSDRSVPRRPPRELVVEFAGRADIMLTSRGLPADGTIQIPENLLRNKS